MFRCDDFNLLSSYLDEPSVQAPPRKQPIQVTTKLTNERQATISSVPPANPPIINVSSNDTQIFSIKPTTATVPVSSTRPSTAIIQVNV
jgi:hypothetical protein